MDFPCNIFVLIPAYKAHDELARFLPELLKKVPYTNICIVDDGSHDATSEVARIFDIDFLQHESNKGKGAALATGFKHLLAKKNVEWIITLDADGQHAPSDIMKFVNAIEANPLSGIIIGARKRVFGTMPPARIFSNKMSTWGIKKLTGIEVGDCQSGYRAYNALFLKEITISHNRFEMETEVILKAIRHGFTIQSTSVQTLYCGSVSHISHVADTLRWMYAVLSIWFTYKKRPTL